MVPSTTRRLKSQQKSKACFNKRTNKLVVETTTWSIERCLLFEGYEGGVMHLYLLCCILNVRSSTKCVGDAINNKINFELTAKSTKCSFPMRTWFSLSGPIAHCSTVMVKHTWERDDLSFIPVAANTPNDRWADNHLMQRPKLIIHVTYCSCFPPP